MVCSADPRSDRWVWGVSHGQAHHLPAATVLDVFSHVGTHLLSCPDHSHQAAAAILATAGALPAAPAEEAAVATAILYNRPGRRRAPIRAWLWVSLGGLTVEMRHQLCRLLLWRYQGSDPWGGKCHPHGVQPTVQDGKRRGTELQKRADLVGPAESERPIPSVRRGCCWKPAPVKTIRVHCGQFQYNGRLGPVISCQKKLWKEYCVACLDELAAEMVIVKRNLN